MELDRQHTAGYLLVWHPFSRHGAPTSPSPDASSDVRELVEEVRVDVSGGVIGEIAQK